MNPKDIFFPYDEIRPIQDKLACDINQAINNQHHLIAHAPTGLGKTAAALAPAVKYAIDNNKTVFFLTPKHTQHQIAVETLRLIKKKHNENFIAVDFVGRQHMCCVSGIENSQHAEFVEFCRAQRKDDLCPYFNNIMAKKLLSAKASQLMSEFERNCPIHVEDFTQRCKESSLCAYELASLLAKDAKVIIGDYYHVFSPSIQKAFFTKLKKDLKNSIIIVDEAHNLPDRIRNLLSSKLTSIGLRFAIKEAQANQRTDLASTLSNLKDLLVDLYQNKQEASNRYTNNQEAYVEKEEFLERFKTLGVDYDQFYIALDLLAEEVRKKSKKSACGGVSNFLENWLGINKGYARIIKKERTKDGKSLISLNYNCLSPALAAENIIAESHSTILMSGTLTPTFMYRDLVGMEPNRTAEREYASPFPAENRLSFINPEVTTKFTERSEDQFRKIGAECADIVNAVPHNSAIFFPSYLLLRNIKPYLEENCSKSIFSEKASLTKAEKALLLRDFKNHAEQGSVLLGAMGASFSEGIDLPGNYLQTVILVGVPLAPPDLETKSLIEYYNELYDKGWDYGYVYPAMSKTLQAAGRCIRSKDDRGAIVFMDKRFAWDSYLKCIPSEWKPVVTKLASQRIKRFFS